MESTCLCLGGNIGCQASRCKETHLRLIKAAPAPPRLMWRLTSPFFRSCDSRAPPFCCTAVSHLEEKIFFLSFGLDFEVSSPPPAPPGFTRRHVVSGEWSIA